MFTVARMDRPWVGLGLRLRTTTGVRPPINAFRLASARGYEVRPVSGPVCTGRVGATLLVDDSGDDLRAKHSAVATEVARGELEMANLPLTAESVDCVARELLLPTPDELRLDLGACDDDLERLSEMHPHVPSAWLADAVEQLRPCNVVRMRVASRRTPR